MVFEATGYAVAFHVVVKIFAVAPAELQCLAEGVVYGFGLNEPRTFVGENFEFEHIIGNLKLGI